MLRCTRDYAQVRPDAFTDWSTREWTEKVGTSLAAKYMDDSYELAVEEQKKELREYKKRAKAQLPQVEPVPMTIETIGDDIPQIQSEESKSIEAQ